MRMDTDAKANGAEHVELAALQHEFKDKAAGIAKQELKAQDFGHETQDSLVQIQQHMHMSAGERKVELMEKLLEEQRTEIKQLHSEVNALRTELAGVAEPERKDLQKQTGYKVLPGVDELHEGDQIQEGDQVKLEGDELQLKQLEYLQNSNKQLACISKFLSQLTISYGKLAVSNTR